ncbi:hypothetical protein [Amycolatopsis sp. cmx-11-12]|uniref:hypothetical protein n=1 Tax=Amycolatopsis sp. cmx-11-12 TaxID=2785795 RepID=UPI00391707B2
MPSISHTAPTATSSITGIPTAITQPGIGRNTGRTSPDDAGVSRPAALVSSAGRRVDEVRLGGGLVAAGGRGSSVMTIIVAERGGNVLAAF